jgi:hypothetical protein
MKPVDPAAFAERVPADFNPQDSMKAEDLFLPSVIEIVKHLARVAAESDYREFLATHAQPVRESDHD